jgi:hypothetical protein
MILQATTKEGIFMSSILSGISSLVKNKGNSISGPQLLHEKGKRQFREGTEGAIETRKFSEEWDKEAH